MAENRLARELENRTVSERPKTWAPADLLPEPDKQPGYVYRWIRTSMMNVSDPRNLSGKIREGWEPVRIEEQPKFKFIVDPASRFSENIEIGGLLLCKAPADYMQARVDFHSKVNKDNMDSVDNNFLRESDPRMPLFSERQSKVTFGSGK